MLRNSRLPDKECDFFTALTDYFPCFFDIKVPGAPLCGCARNPEAGELASPFRASSRHPLSALGYEI